MTRDEEIAIWILSQFNDENGRFEDFFIDNDALSIEESNPIIGRLLQTDDLRSTSLNSQQYNQITRTPRGKSTLDALIEKRRQEQIEKEKEDKYFDLDIKHKEEAINKIRFDKKTSYVSISIAIAALIVSIISLYFSLIR